MGQHTMVSATRFREMFDEVRSWDRWAGAGRAGALNLLTAEQVRAAAGLVRDGVPITLSRPLDTEKRVDNPRPAEHRMTQLATADDTADGVHFAKDYIGIAFHNDGHSHIDAFSHVAYDGKLYGGYPHDSVTAAGAEHGAIDALADGLVGRGVLLDIPRLRGVAWLEPGESTGPDELEAAALAQGVAVGTGDILLVRTGHGRRLDELDPWDTSRSRAGLDPEVVPLLARWQVSALGSDGNNDTAPGNTEGEEFPVHVLAVNALGLHLMDYLWLERLAGYCAEVHRWEFLLVVAPLRIVGGTGSPVNPIAIL